MTDVEGRGPVIHERNLRNGLFSGFEGYRTPTSEDYQRLLSSGLVVPDANVLLNLYRYDDAARDALVRVLTALVDRLWIPHQVLVEFWRNRESVLRDPRDTHKAADELAGHREKAMQAFRSWANRVSLEEEHSSSLTATLAEAFNALSAAINERDLEDASLYARDTGADPVLQVLEPVLEGKCGSRLEGEEHETAVAEGLRRVDERLPPGYLDKKKGERGAAGDYIIWEQVLQEATRRQVDVLFITGDVKEDWWREEGGERRGPRLELVEELRRRAGVRLFMLRPTSLLEHARAHLGVDVGPESVQVVERVEQFLSEEGTGAAGWTMETAALLLSRLDVQAPVQSAAIRLAARQGGCVDREQVYELGRYSDERSLRGFTRPVTRLVQEMRSRGEVSEDVADVLVTKYDGGAVTATGFEVEPSFLPFVDPVVDERKVLRYLVMRLGSGQGGTASAGKIADGSGMPMPLLGRVLISLHEKGFIEGVMAAQVAYPIAVLRVTPAGCSFAGMVSGVPVRREDGSVIAMNVELDQEASELLRQGFVIKEAYIGEDGRFSISFAGQVTEGNLDFVRSLGGGGKQGETEGRDNSDPS